MSFPSGPLRELALETATGAIKSHFDSLQEANEKKDGDSWDESLKH